jgi:hypothetical protein
MGKYKGGVYHVDDQVRLEPHRKDVNALLSDALGRKVTLVVSYDEDRERANDRDDLHDLEHGLNELVYRYRLHQDAPDSREIDRRLTAMEHAAAKLVSVLPNPSKIEVDFQAPLAQRRRAALEARLSYAFDIASMDDQSSADDGPVELSTVQAALSGLVAVVRALRKNMLHPAFINADPGVDASHLKGLVEVTDPLRMRLGASQEKWALALFQVITELKDNTGKKPKPLIETRAHPASATAIHRWIKEHARRRKKNAA